jgi:general secretion pathway protein D
VILVALSAVVAVPIRADRAKDAYNSGSKEERQAHYEAAYLAYKQASTLAPSNAKYVAAYTRMRFNAAAQHVRSGQLLQNTGALTAALTEFQQAIEIDSSSFVAQQELRRTAEMIRRQERQKSTPKIDPSEGLLKDLAPSLEVQPLPNSAINLRIAANADVIYKTIGKMAGLNVVIDPEYRPQRVSLELSDVTMREALDMLKLQSKTFWRPVSANTIFVTSDSPAKRKEMEQNVIRTFYLRNITTPNELQDAGNMVRQILDVARVQLLPTQDAMIVRGTPDQMLLAEKLLADFDKPKAEVIINIVVMQVSRDRLRSLGTTLPTTISVAAIPGELAVGGSGGNGGVPIKNYPKLFSSGNFVLTVPGASFTALATDSNTKILQSPEIRALNNEKATLRIGDRVPIATGSFQPGMVGAGGVNPLVSTQFTYLDVGVNIDVLPHIHSDNEVTLKMSLEISAVTGSQNIGGITQPVIGQRRIEHETRAIDGDVNLLGGILEETETQSMSGYPWLSRMPLLRYLFCSGEQGTAGNGDRFCDYATHRACKDGDRRQYPDPRCGNGQFAGTAAETCRRSGFRKRPFTGTGERPAE